MVLVVRDIMRREFLAVPAERDVRSCAEEMARRHEGFALVTEAGRAAAIVTEWDFLERVIAAGRDPARVPIGEVASRPVKSVPVDAPTIDVVDRMGREGIRRMVVLEAGLPVGVVTSKEVYRVFRAYVDRVSSDNARLQSNPMP